MSEETEVLYAGNSSDQPLTPLSWFQTWKLAITRPSVATYEQIAYDTNASAGLAYKSIFIAAFIGYGVSFAIQTLSDGSYASRVVLESALSAIGVLLATVIFAAIAHWMAKIMGGRGTYARLVYAMAASDAPLTLIAGVIGTVDILACLAFPLAIYNIVLNIIAVMAVHHIGWGKAIASILTPILLILVIALALVLGALAIGLIQDFNSLPFFNEGFDMLGVAPVLRWVGVM